MASTFTFVNTVDAPSLSASSAKAMRAHVTKANFANRRKRIAAEKEGWQKASDEEHSLRGLTAQQEPRGQFQAVPTEKQKREVMTRRTKWAVSRTRKSRQAKPPAAKLSREDKGSQVVVRSPLMTLRPDDPYITMAYCKGETHKSTTPLTRQ